VLIIAVLTGLLAGALLGAVLHRGQLCLHAASRGVLEGRTGLAQGWVLGVAVGAVGFALLLLLPGTDGLDRGLALRPVGNVVGGLVTGVGMVVARTCASGLFWKLGAGMVGAAVGLFGWGAGELLARQVDLPGPTVLPGGEGAGLPGLLRLLVAGLVLAVVLVLLRRARRRTPERPWQWGPARTGLLLGLALTAAWGLAALGGSSFGASSVGAAASVANGRPRWWLLAFLAGLVLGSAVAARAAGAFWLRGETAGRLAGLAAGGALVGAGGWWAGGCVLGHGLSGATQLSVSSYVVVASIVAGAALAASVERRLRDRRGDRGADPAAVREVQAY
jgi:uncharacterized membrane protein YedE/YeeE